MSDSQRVFHVKPGDTLVFGNVGPIPADEVRDALSFLKNSLGLAQVIIFESDIDMDLVPDG